MRAAGVAAIVASLLAACSGSSSATPPAGLQVVGDTPLTGGSSRFDYESLDTSTHHLVIAHLGASTVTVFDTHDHRVVRDIPGIADVHGVLAVPQLGRIYASAAGDNAVAVLDST